MRPVERVAARVRESEHRLDTARRAAEVLTDDERDRFLVELMAKVEVRAEREKRVRQSAPRRPAETRSWHLAGEGGRTRCNRRVDGLLVAQDIEQTPPDNVCSRCQRANAWRDSEGRSAADRPRKAPSYGAAIETALAGAEGRPLGTGELFELVRKVLPGAKHGTVAGEIARMRDADPPRIVQRGVSHDGPLYGLPDGGAEGQTVN